MTDRAEECSSRELAPETCRGDAFMGATESIVHALTLAEGRLAMLLAAELPGSDHPTATRYVLSKVQEAIAVAGASPSPRQVDGEGSRDEPIPHPDTGAQGAGDGTEARKALRDLIMLRISTPPAADLQFLSRKFHAAGGADIDQQTRINDWLKTLIADAAGVATHPPLVSIVVDMLAALRGVVAVADRRTKEFDAARAAIVKAEALTLASPSLSPPTSEGERADGEGSR